MHANSSVRQLALPLLPALSANAACQAFLLVVLPSLGRDLGFTPLETGLLLGSAALLLIIFAPIWGGISEKTGRKRVILIGLAAAALASALMAAVIALRLNGILERVPTLMLLFIVRACQSMLGAGLLPAAQAWIADHTTPENRAVGMGLLGASYGVGGIIGAGAAFAVGGSHPIGALGGLTIFILLGFYQVYAAVFDRPEIANRDASPLARINIRSFMSNLSITFIGVAVYAIMQHVTALRLEDAMKLTRTEAISQAGAALMGAAITMVLAQTLGVAMLKSPPRQLILAGAGIGTLSLIAVTFAASPTVLLTALFLMGGALGILLPGNLALISIKAGIAAQGRAAGINAVAQGLAMAAGPVAGAALHRLSPQAPGYLSAIAMFVALIICLNTKGKS
ncbi:MFS transporter [Brucella intermedia]|uniref:MFS transporter n=1 Tax=Brucella intermedia TaxID=94625 RepID=UPI002248D554|nr:MFS transporter [Brucella intermedia]